MNQVIIYLLNIKESKEKILAKAVLNPNDSIAIQRLCQITKQTVKAVKLSVENVRNNFKVVAEKENKTLEEIVKQFYKQINYF